MEFNLNIGDKIIIKNDILNRRNNQIAIVKSKIKKVGRGMNYSLYVETTLGKVALDRLEKI